MSSTTEQARVRAGIIVALLIAATTATAAVDPRLAPYLLRIEDGGPRDRVLNDMEAGLAAFEIGDLDSSAACFEDAIVNIESIYSESTGARQAQSLWFEEGRKEFKGEPYERVMAYFYRGLLHMMEGQGEDARATFTAGVAQDRFGAEEEYVFDFALMIFLQGWAARLRGDDVYARARWKEVAAILPAFVPPSPAANVLVVVETGRAPRKVADGVGHYQLKYRRGRDFQEAVVRLGAPFPAEALLAEDLFFQASTRGGRVFDGKLRAKAAHRQTASDIGMALGNEGSALSAVTTAGTSASNLAGAAQVLGSIALLYSSRVKPKADVRYWRTLPDTIHVFAIEADRASVDAMTAHYEDESGASVELPSVKVVRWIPGSPDQGIAWIRSRSALDVPLAPKGSDK